MELLFKLYVKNVFYGFVRLKGKDLAGLVPMHQRAVSGARRFTLATNPNAVYVEVL